MGLRNAEEVYKEARRRLKREPNELVWDFLIREEWIEGAIGLGPGGESPNYTIEEVIEEYRKFENLLNQALESQGLVAKRQSLKRRVAPDKALEAQAEISAVEAADLPYVRAFRDRVLDGHLLDYGEARAWLGSKLAKKLAPRFPVSLVSAQRLFKDEHVGGRRRRAALSRRRDA